MGGRLRKGSHRQGSAPQRRHRSFFFAFWAMEDSVE
jgi:hypothetical protein